MKQFFLMRQNNDVEISTSPKAFLSFQFWIWHFIVFMRENFIFPKKLCVSKILPSLSMHTILVCMCELSKKESQKKFAELTNEIKNLMEQSLTLKWNRFIGRIQNHTKDHWPRRTFLLTIHIDSFQYHKCTCLRHESFKEQFTVLRSNSCKNN